MKMVICKNQTLSVIHAKSRYLCNYIHIFFIASMIVKILYKQAALFYIKITCYLYLFPINIHNHRSHHHNTAMPK